MSQKESKLLWYTKAVAILMVSAFWKEEEMKQVFVQ